MILASRLNLHGNFRTALWCGLAAALLGSVGMIAADQIFPTQIHSLKKLPIDAVLFSGMTAGMLVFCIPACIFVCCRQKKLRRPRPVALVHLIGAIGMLAGMTAGTYAAATSLGNLNHTFQHLALYLAMAIGMGCGTFLAYFISLAGFQPVTTSALHSKD